MFDADLYRLVHRGNPGDLAFYRRLCRGVGRVLELGCGDGRVAEPIAADGASVVGIESHPDMVAACAGKGFEVVSGDMGAFELPGPPFDRIIVPYTALYCLADDDAVVECLRCIARHLAPDGLFAFDGYLVNPDLPGGEDEPEWLTTVYEDEGRVDVFENGSHSPEAHDFEVTYTHQVHVGDEMRQTAYTLHHHYVNAADLPDLFERADLAIEAVYGDFDEGPFVEEEAERLVVVGRHR